MNQQYNTSALTKDFLIKCFEYLSNNISDDEIVKNRLRIKLLIRVLANNFENFTKNAPAELFFLITDKCVREVINDEIHKNILLNLPLLDGIATENEIDDLFAKISHSIPPSKQRENVVLILQHLSKEIYEILFEYNNISKHIENKNKLDRENATNSVEAKIEAAEKNVTNLRKQINSSLVKIKNNSAITNKRLNNFSKNIKDTEKRMYETNITILSIFSVVALTANTAIGFYTSTISALGNASTYKLVFVLLIVGLICSNALMILFYYLNKIFDDIPTTSKVSAPMSKWRKFLSVIIKPFSTLKPILVSNIIIIALMFILLCAWNNGYIEKRNDKVYQQYYSQTESSSSSQEESNDSKETSTTSSVSDTTN